MKVEWKELLRSVAPALGAAVGGPAGGLAVKFLADKFLGKPDASEEDVAAAITGATPDQMLQIKKLDADFKVKMRELEIDVFKLETADKADARALARVDMRPHVALTCLYTVCYFAILYMFMVGEVEVDKSVRSAFDQIIGVLTAGQVTIMAFWFGSSHGSKTKE